MDIKNIHVPYDSPIEVNFINDMMKQTINKVMEDMDNAIYKSVVHAGVNVEKDKLVEVFTQDKRRYEEAYRKGYAQRDAEIVRCKDCRYSLPSSENIILCTAPCESQYPKAYKPIDWFCAGGERNDGDGD